MSFGRRYFSDRRYQTASRKVLSSVGTPFVLTEIPVAGSPPMFPYRRVDTRTRCVIKLTLSLPLIRLTLAQRPSLT